MENHCFFLGKSTISMAIFHSYVNLPEGILKNPQALYLHLIFATPLVLCGPRNLRHNVGSQGAVGTLLDFFELKLQRPKKTCQGKPSAGPRGYTTNNKRGCTLDITGDGGFQISVKVFLATKDVT